VSEDNFLTKALIGTDLTRRSFLKWSAALGGAVAATGVLNYGLKAADAAVAAAASEGKWVAAACWHNCGGRCLNKAYVVDGVVIKQKTDDTHPDSPDYPQQRGCARGRSNRMRAFGADRLKYPMKRKNWAPGGGDKSLRGRDEWMRISWDEALDILASETKRIKEKYGNKSILWGTRSLALYGGYVNSWGSSSSGTWAATAPRVAGDYLYGNDRLDMRKSKLIVMWSTDPMWVSAGLPTYNYFQAKKAGAKFIFIDPFYNNSAQILADEWIPIRPGTDTPMLLAIGYTLITEDDPKTNPLIDWDFLSRCTIGFDKTSLPAGADPEENFKDYVLGLDASGKPAPKGHKNYPAKTPEWASEICGTPAKKIRTFAIEIAQTHPVAFMESDASARINNAQSFGQAFTTIAAMIGSIGVSGGGFGQTRHSTASNKGPNLITTGANGAVLKSVPNPIETVRINGNELWDAVLNGKYTDSAGPKKDINIQMVYHTKGSYLQTQVGQAKGIQAMRKVEFAVCQDFHLTSGARYSDLVLPVTHMWERDGYVASPNREALFWASQVMPPLFETKDDEWIDWELGKRLGVITASDTPELPLKQRIFNQIAGATVMKDDGKTTEPLVTITDQDLKDLGVTGKVQTGRVPVKQFQANGSFQVPRKPGDNFTAISLKTFREDPVKNPVKTESGKIEIYCQALAKYINGLGWSVIRPIPAYIPAEKGYEDTFSDWEKKIKGEFPLQMYNKHYMRRSHSEFDNVLQLREAFPQEFYMSTRDAEARGIKQGDIVLIRSAYGKCIRPAYVTQRLMPGVCSLPHGAWVEMDEATGIDKAGSDNNVEGGVPTVEGHHGYNSQTVQVEKYTGTLELKPDALWPQRIPLKGA
jgi:anaerobic dimethyl sulfoxide reductase subunit A